MRSTVFAGSIIDREIKLETEAVREGVARYQRTRREVEARGDAAMLKPAERLLAHWFQCVVDMLELERAKMEAKKERRDLPHWHDLFMAMDSERMAVCAMHEAVGACVQNPGGFRKVHLAGRIGGAIAAEFHADRLAEHQTGASMLKHMRRLRKPRDFNDLHHRILGDTRYGMAYRYGLGGAVLEVLIHICSTKPYGGDHGIVRAFEVRTRRRRGKSSVEVFLSNEDQAIIDEGHEARQGMRPRYLPMIVPPYPWTADAEGGYVRVRTPLIIGMFRSQREALASGDLAATYDGINTLSATPWRINRRVMAAAKELWERGGGALDIPPAHNFPLPERPAGADREAMRAWNAERAEIHTRNAHLRGPRKTFLTRLGIAERFVDDEAIYFPHQLDFRGRAYPIPQGLNHQQGDLSRGLLEFADARPAGETGGYWLRVHLANCCGVDKVSYDARVAWVEENVDGEVLGRVMESPLDEPLWQAAEKPWEALAALIALADPDAGSHLPVQMDGTCNGIQHLAALGRDPQAGGLVNLIPGDKPADLYTAVADAVRLLVEQDKADGSEAAVYALPWIKRKIIKRVPMTKPYGVTHMGAVEQILEELQAAGLPRDQAKMIARYLGPRVLEAVDEVCPGPAAIMAWFRACAGIVTKAGSRLSWNAPGGFPVVQPYMNLGRTRVCTLGKRRMHIVNVDAELSVNRKRQLNGSSPNVVHAIDARHMLSTAVACRQAGVTFAGVHDSYWSHAADVPVVAALTRERFVALHKADLLDGLRAQWEALCGKELPAPPERGWLDLDQVPHSAYFFS